MSHTSFPQSSSDWNFRKWLVPMLLISLLVHFGLMLALRFKRLETFAPVQTERLIPRAFKMERTTMDPKLLQPVNIPEPAKVATKPIPDVAKVQITEPKKTFAELSQDIRATPMSADLAKPLLNEKPLIDPAKVDAAMNQMQKSSAIAIERELDTLRKQLSREKPDSINQPSLRAQGLTDSSAELVDDPSDVTSRKRGNSAGPDDGTQGFSNLDQLISQTGPLTSGTAPILMPTDLLFDYDSFILRDGAVSSLRKLGQLILRNPNASFVIEGHTDSYGGAEYNQRLSLSRADQVKTWLLQNMAIDPRRVQTRGYGSSKLLVQAGKSVQEQELNRRVEIVIKAH